jgi:hypothetical protein
MTTVARHYQKYETTKKKPSRGSFRRNGKPDVHSQVTHNEHCVYFNLKHASKGIRRDDAGF